MMADSPRPRGRPRVDEDRALKSTVTVSVTAPEHDWLIRQARQQETSVSGLLRGLIVRATK